MMGQGGRVQAKYAAADTLNLITTEDCPYGLSILDGEAQECMLVQSLDTGAEQVCGDGRSPHPAHPTP